MAEIKSQKVGLSDCRSLGSNQHQSGRSAKVSIGITVVKSPRTPATVSGIGKENVPAMQSPEKHSSCKGRVKSRSREAENSKTSKVELKEQKSSECLQLRFLSHKTSNIGTGEFYVDHIPKSAHKKVDGLAYKHNREEDINTYVDQELTFVSMQKKDLLDHEISSEVDKSNTNGLKMKLWEILGGDPSQKEHNMDSPNLHENKENIGVDHNRGLRKDKTARSKYCSDPIETDSDSPNQTVRRPATRSMTRKINSNKIVRSLDDALNVAKEPLSSTCSDYKRKFEENLEGHVNEKNIYLFGRENSRMQNQKEYANTEAHIELRNFSRSSPDNKPNIQTNFKRNDKEDIFSFGEVVENKGTSKKSANARSKRLNKNRNATIEKKEVNLLSGSSSKSTQQKDEKGRIFPSHAEGLQQIETSTSLPCPSKKRSIQPKNAPNDSQNSQINQQNLSGIPPVPDVCETLKCSLPEKEKGSWEYLNSSPMPKFTFQCDKIVCSPGTSTADASDDLHSPTFAASPSTQNVPSNNIAGNPLQRNTDFTWNFHNPDIMDNDKPGSCGSESNTNDTRNVYESHGLESTFEVGSETKEQLTLSPIAKHDTQSFVAKGLKIKDFRGRNRWFPSVNNTAKSPLKPYKKRVHGPKDLKFSEGDEAYELHEASGRSIEDSLARAVNQLALALQRIKSKIQFHTNKKSCEILAAVAKNIKLQLRDVDSQIQEDMDKFMGSSKTKRKRLESRLGEHQERIRSIHDKFKEEADRHFLNCSSTLEEIEAQNFEMKGTADRQKILHRKLLLQSEEAIKVQLTEAEASIAAVRKEAKKKYNNLKFALKEWMGEAAIS